jgi:hypothetical protein
MEHNYPISDELFVMIFPCKQKLFQCRMYLLPARHSSRDGIGIGRTTYPNGYYYRETTKFVLNDREKKSIIFSPNCLEGLAATKSR